MPGTWWHSGGRLSELLGRPRAGGQGTRAVLIAACGALARRLALCLFGPSPVPLGRTPLVQCINAPEDSGRGNVNQRYPS